MSRLTYLNESRETTELTQFEGDSWEELIKNADTVDQIFMHNAIDKLYEYEELEEQGLLLKLPYPLGTKKVYLIDGYEIDELNATGITLYKANENATRPHETVICVDYCDFYYDDIGKTVFLTKEEAEQELKRLESAE